MLFGLALATAISSIERASSSGLDLYLYLTTGDPYGNPSQHTPHSNFS